MARSTPVTLALRVFPSFTSTTFSRFVPQQQTDVDTELFRTLWQAFRRTAALTQYYLALQSTISNGAGPSDVGDEADRLHRRVQLVAGSIAREMAPKANSHEMRW